MDDSELAALRASRMRELQGGSSSSGGGGVGAGDMSGLPSGLEGGPSEEQHQQQQQQQRAQMEEQKRTMLSTVLDHEARERLSRINLVKPEKARAIQDLILRMAQSGQVRQRITEPQLIGLLEQIESQGRGGSGSGSTQGKITFTRKKQVDDSDSDSDFDL